MIRSQFENIAIKARPVDSNANDGRWFLIINGREFVVSHAVVELTSSYVKNSGVRNLIKDEIFSNWGYNPTDAELDSFENNHLPKLINNDDKHRDDSIDRFWFYQKIVPTTLVSKLATLSNGLFNPIVALVLVMISAAVFYAYSSNIVSLHHAVTLSIFFKAYLMALTIVLCHELGHATAYKRSLIKDCGPIYFGFIFVMPAFFVKLKETACLDKTTKLMIDLGGLYFQVASIIPIALCFRMGWISAEIFGIALSANIYLLVFNLIPVLKFDGYWILSTLTNVPNLSKRSANEMSIFIKSCFNLNLRWPSWLALYGMIRTIITLAFFIIFIISLPTSLVKLINAFMHDHSLITIFYHLLKVTITLFMAIMVLKPIVKYFTKRKAAHEF